MTSGGNHSPFGEMLVIANPHSGRGAASLTRIERALHGAGLGYRIARTAGRGHATELAREALRGGGRYLVAAGGDGTVHEVVNGMLDDDGRPVAADAVLGVLACGSGCDFVRSFGLPGDVAAAVHHLTGSGVRRIDVGRLTCASGVTRYFVNIAEAGLGGTVVARTAGLPGFLGGARYLCGFWLTLPGFRPATVRLEVDGQAYQWRAHNLVVANGRFYGGGMQISPASEPDDGALDVLVMAGPKSDAFTIVPLIYRGRHLPHRNIAAMRAGRVRVDADPPFDIEADGEVLGSTPATFEIIPGAIRLKI